MLSVIEIKCRKKFGPENGCHAHKQKDLCSLQRLIEELKIENMKANFRVSKGACYRFISMALM